MSEYTIMVAFRVTVPGSEEQAKNRLTARLEATVPLDENVERFEVLEPQAADDIIDAIDRATDDLEYLVSREAGDYDEEDIAVIKAKLVRWASLSRQISDR